MLGILLMARFWDTAVVTEGDEALWFRLDSAGLRGFLYEEFCAWTALIPDSDENTPGRA